MDNYFTFFGIEEAFNIDMKALRLTFITNSKKYHPDFHTLQSEAEQERVLDLSTLNNKAWKTLSDPQKRTAHILEVNDAMPEEGKAQVPQEFLMEMMDINESLMELEFEDDASKKSEVLSALSDLEEEIRKESDGAKGAWDEDKESRFLEVIRDCYLKQKYLWRIRERLG